MLRYVSTRGSAPALPFSDVLLEGLAVDGGLYVPEEFPLADSAAPGVPYAAFAATIMWPFVDGSIDRAVFDGLVHDAYSRFDDDEVAPLVRLDDRIELVELFHGPTLAFKDVAMQLLGRLFDHELERRGQHVTIVGATSGDTGSAAIEAFRDRANVDIVILHPFGRTSEVQRRQMTTVLSPNVHNIAVDGTFDDCQDMVKAMFADTLFRRRVGLAAVNSINWARVMAQIVYYHWAAGRHARAPEPVRIAVPTGNFGNVFAGHVARRMGAPIGRFLVASNRNDILTQFFSAGSMTIGAVEPSLSPSMDIQVSSNLERLLYELLGHDGDAVVDFMDRFRTDGRVELAAEAREVLGAAWSGESVTDDQTLGTMRQVHEQSGMIIDPHTAVGVAAARRRGGDAVVMATAHPAKFPDAVEQATGHRPELPARLRDLYEREERFQVVPNDLEAVRASVGSIGAS